MLSLILFFVKDRRESMFEDQPSIDFQPDIERQKSEYLSDYDSMFVLACNLQQLIVTANMGSIMGPTTYVITSEQNGIFLSIY